ncbi:hypothetical protein FOA43_000079 [Brettanomyces nanus]|uniref:Kinetochore protein NUF2 n=1 Tax=Eeniella nana TaxID=13502 RepID=A0A875RWF1_EENNA|nr:uncharacterized protein FOA43_000079 [Brettanomyces nanus]QPG72778.1 hypothetical protein FOA43_000079 [Brettanomyces nanus]
MPRPSSIYRFSKVPAFSRTQYKFPILEADEIIQVFDALDFGVSEAMLVKPTFSFMNSLIEQVLDKFLYVPPYSLRKKIQETQFEDAQEEDNLHTSMNVMAPKRIVYKFLCDCGVNDFSIRDVSKPDPTRVRIILSAIINFARFREERMNDCDGLLDSSEDVIVKYREVLEKNEKLENQMTSLNNQIAAEGYTMDEVDERNNLLENQLKELRSNQQKLASEHTKYKSEKTGLIKELENQSALYIASEKDLEQVRPYIKESPESVRELITRMQESLAEEQEKLKNLETRSRKISISFDSFQLLIQEFKLLNRTLEDVQVETSKQDSSSKALNELKNETEERESVIKDYTRRVAQIERQVQHNEERIEKLSKFYSDKLGQLQEKMEQKSTELASLKTKKAEQDADATSKKSQIELWQMQMSNLKRSFETECREASFELEKLNSHIQLYEVEMSKKLKEQKNELGLVNRKTSH